VTIHGSRSHSPVLAAGVHLAAAIESSSPDCAAWVGVYPRDLASPTTREFIRNMGYSIFPSQGRAYHVRSFEVRRAPIEADASIGKRELINRRSYLAFHESELTQRLAEPAPLWKRSICPTNPDTRSDPSAFRAVPVKR
jgi:hypothetical protein